MKRYFTFFIFSLLLIAGLQALFIGDGLAETEEQLIQRFVDIALAQEGYCEYGDNGNKFGEAFSANYQAWCGYFVMWCGREAGIYGDRIKYLAYIPNTASVYGSRYHTKGSGYNPQIGDLAIYDKDGNGNNDHIGIIYAVDSEKIYTIEGNLSDQVKKDWWYMNRSNSLVGYVQIRGGSNPTPSCDEYYKVIDPTGLNLRSTPDGTLIVNVPQNTIVHVTQKQKSGSYEWGYTTYNGQTGWLCIGNSTWATRITDSESPIIANVRVTDIDSSGYTVLCDISDNTGVTSVKFPSWYEGQTGEDAIWHEGTISGNTASCRINVADHNGRNGLHYITHIYAYDAAGNSSGVSQAQWSCLYVLVPCQPGKPAVSASSSDSLHDTILSWGATSNTDWYDIRIYSSEGTNIYGRAKQTNCQFAALLPAGSYQADIASVNGTYGTYTFSDRVSFSVKAATASGLGTLIESIQYDGRLYCLYQKNCTWLEAKSLAEQSGGHLVTITSQAEQDVATRLANISGGWTWIGAEWYSRGEFQWITGETMSYTNWNSGQPDYYRGLENCAHLYANGKWNDIQNDSESEIYGYIAEYEAKSAAVTPIKTRFAAGHALAKDDLAVEVTFANGTVRSVDDYAFTLTDMTPGEQTVTITYGSLTASCFITLVRVIQPADLTLPAALIAIDEEAFAALPVSVVKCNDGLEEIGARAFANCANLSEIYIPESVVTIARTAFTGCSDDLTIFGVKGSVAESFARARGYTFVEVID
ncbi:MAG: leucine-rich repeat protein [Clostridia bacterium]|nr:leucine-rich repeat protein [Clostridia bacterium]